MSTSTRLTSIEILRGLAASAVCLFHLICGNPAFFPETSLIEKIGQYGFLGVEVFFVISGFIIPYSLKKSGYTWHNIGPFIWRRLVRLEPPYIASIAAVIGLNLFAAQASGFAGQQVILNPSQLILHLGYLIPFSNYSWLNPVYWTLAIEFQFYLLTSVLFLLMSRLRNAGFFVLCLLLTGSSLLVAQDYLFFHYAAFFVLGFALYKRFCGEISSIAFYALTALTVLTIGYTFDIRYCIAVCIPILMIHFTPTIQHKGLEFLGKISYSLYLIHVPVGGKIINLSARFSEQEGPRILIVVVAYMFCIYTSYLFYRFIELPALRWSQHIRYRHR